MLTTPIESLRSYVNAPSGSYDKEDVQKVADMFAQDFASLGFSVEIIPGERFGPKLLARIGTGERQLMLMGHMDTVFPRDSFVPFTPLDDHKALGSGSIDMKGGVVVMLYALQKVLPSLDLSKVRLAVLLNADEETGSAESHDLIYATAKESFAALSFEPCGPSKRFTCARKGVTSVEIACTGIPGHAGAKYKECASAIQALCALVTKLYTLRDDERDISFNAGVISGGTAENVVAPSALCRCEFRYFDESLKPSLSEKILEICQEEVVPQVKTKVTFGASHPAVDISPQSQALLDLALAICKEQGIDRHHEKTGGAGDISMAAQAGIGVLDGLGLAGDKMHTTQEVVYLDSLPEQIELAAELIKRVCVM